MNGAMELSIGEIATLGQVSTRMLRHYDQIGLFRPAAVNPTTGYRSYAPSQVEDLHRIVVLKDLGFALDEVATMLAEDISEDELRGMLRLRRSQIESDIRSSEADLASVDHRLSLLAGQDQDGSWASEVIVKSVPARLVAELSELCPSFDGEHVGPALNRLYPRLLEAMGDAGVSATGTSMAYDLDAEGGDGSLGKLAGGEVYAHASIEIGFDPKGPVGFEVVELPGIETVAAAIHEGPMEQVDETVQRVRRWISDHRYEQVGYARELDLNCGVDTKSWVTELQFPIR